MQFWRGTLHEAKEAFVSRKPRGEMTLLIEGKVDCVDEVPQDSQIENELRELISSGHSLSMVMAGVGSFFPLFQFYLMFIFSG